MFCIVQSYLQQISEVFSLPFGKATPLAPLGRLTSNMLRFGTYMWLLL